MNERIKELEKQSVFYNEDEEIWETDLKKFAELIVRECAELAKHNVMNISTYADAEFVEEQIKENFGIK